MIFVKSSLELAEVELEIANSDPFFIRVSKDKEQFDLQEIEEEIRNSASAGCERFLIQDDGRYVGVLEFLLNNPRDGRTWLGLLQIHKAEQGRGYGARVMQQLYEMMKERQVESFFIGVIEENAPAHAFWTKMGFVPLPGRKSFDGKPVIIYEKTIAP